jgi:hypothetical protein
MAIVMKRFLYFLLGTITALIVSLIFGCILFRFFTGMNPFEGNAFMIHSSVSSRAFSIGSIPNIGLFYLFLNKHNYDSARGVIFSFILIGFYVIFS